MHINVHLRQTIYEMTICGFNQLNQQSCRCCSASYPLQPGRTPFQPHTQKHRRQRNSALEMTSEHLPDLQLLQVHLINIGMNCGAVEALYRTILGSPPTLWQSLSTSLTVTMGSFSLLMFYCSTTTVREVVISYKCKKAFQELEVPDHHFAMTIPL